MTLYLDLSNYVLLMITVDEQGKPCAILHKEVAGEFERVAQVSVDGEGQYQFSIQMNESQAEFIVSDSHHQLSLGAVDVSFLSGGYTGNFIGLDVIDMYRRNESSATFTDFSYKVTR